MIIQHNISALDASRHLSSNKTNLNKNLEKLSSGFKINRAADDAAGLAISESLRNKLKGIDQAKNNAEDGINMIQTAEGALTEVHAMLERGTTLATQAANGTYTDDTRQHIDKEFQELKKEIDRISESTDYNGINLLNGLHAAGNISSVTQILSDDEIDAKKTLVKNLVGNSGESILSTFSSLTSGFPAQTDVSITLKSLPGSTLANAGGTYTGSGRGYIKVNADLDKIDSISTASYGSTIAHEMMHGVMGVALAKAGTSMTQLKSGDNLWFVEGTAQLAGGLFNAGWNLDIRSAAQTGNAANMRAALANHTSPTNEVYGTGALMTAYIGYLANQGPSFEGTINTSSSGMGTEIKNGINKIFNEILNNNKTLEEAIQITTGRSESSIMSDFAGAESSTNFVNFCISVGRESGSAGAGSVMAGLSTSLDNIVSTGNYSPGHFIMDDVENAGYGQAGGDVILQIGPTAEETISIMRFDMSSSGLGLSDSNVLTHAEACEAMGALKEAVENTSLTRAYFGAKQNRLEHTINNLEITNENVTSAESRIRDTDMAGEISKFTKNNILMQAAQSMLAQANQSPQGVLSMLD